MLCSMERRILGRTGIAVPVVGLGTYRVFNVVGDAAEARCEAVVDAALAGGSAFFDSSPMYGESERVLAQALSERRDQGLVATKVWARDRAIGEQQIERALGWFGHVDVYQIHNLLAVEEHLPVLRELRAAGRIRAIGATHYLPSGFDALLPIMRRHEVEVVQVPYHPLERAVEAELLPEAESLNIGVVVMMPFGSGRLLKNPPRDEELAPLAEFGVYTWPQVLLKWILSEPAVHAVIPATSSADHMGENLVAGAPPWFTGDERLYVRQLAARAN